MPVKNLVFIFAFCSFLTAGAQDYAPLGATWHYEVGAARSPFISYGKWKAVSDTIISGKNCRKIKNFHLNADYVDDTVMFVYEDSGVVFQYIPAAGNFTTLYNFNAKTGDTWNFALSDTCSIPVIVDSTGNTVINNLSLRVLYVTYDTVTRGTLVERLGNISFPLPDEYFHCKRGIWDGLYYNGLRCYSDSSMGQVDSLPDSLFTSWSKPNFKRCDTVFTSLKEISNGKGITVFPNPNQGSFTIEGGVNNSLLTIFNSYGQIISSQTISGKQKTDIQLNAPPGIYFLQLKTEEGVYRKKIVLQ